MRYVMLVLGALFLAGTSALAHHSYGATYSTKKEIKLEGKLLTVLLSQPAFVRHRAGAGRGRRDAALVGRVERDVPAGEHRHHA